MRIFTEWWYKPDPNPLLDADAIIGMAFGANRKGSGQSPGISNEAIARNIERLYAVKNLPVIAQREVAEALNEISSAVKPSMIISEDDGQFHISSCDVLLRAWQWCELRNLRNIIIVAHPAHILRCAWVAEKMGFAVKLPALLPIPYEPGSTQWWTRNWLFFFLWELRARIGWKIKGYL